MSPVFASLELDAEEVFAEVALDVGLPFVDEPLLKLLPDEVPLPELLELLELLEILEPLLIIGLLLV